MTTINTNTAALTARLYLERNDKVREEAFARLASGQKVNSSADDAAGLAIECPSEIIDAIGGWTTEGVGHQYGKGHSLAIMHGWMERIV